jgi:hypothetical protein
MHLLQCQAPERHALTIGASAPKQFGKMSRGNQDTLSLFQQTAKRIEVCTTQIQHAGWRTRHQTSMIL